MPKDTHQSKVLVFIYESTLSNFQPKKKKKKKLHLEAL